MICVCLVCDCWDELKKRLQNLLPSGMANKPTHVEGSLIAQISETNRKKVSTIISFESSKRFSVLIDQLTERGASIFDRFVENIREKS